ncbi:hypothetical protein BI364_08800 [Acidihalobacter yilgarnensis]|uniref:Putative DNA-binding domain-containing protein n=1 Tax=Acidihalobacter yilgarnensis TaxID=2819280 RepID=A0A1D8INK4_9GAMM|nr:DNA-binding domain-containing protein [Acidihalobacter yilgarnensis]AOU98047.1 hypothetical protein BI364_08800 [Acidihalobacter yilgarnensis]
MNTLAELQTAFAVALEHPEQVDAVRLRHEGIAAPRRIGLYRNNTRITQTEALAGIYPAVQKLVGEDFFAAFAEHYRTRYPSRSGDLRDFGGTLAECIAEFDPAAGLPYLPDVARLEWDWHLCFHAEEVEALDVSGLARLAEDVDSEPALALIPAAKLLHSPYPAADIWAFALEPEPRQGTLDLDALAPAYLLIARPTDEVLVLSLAPADYHWLAHVAAGESLSTALEATLEIHPDFDLAERLPSLVSLGVFTAHQAGEKP